MEDEITGRSRKRRHVKRSNRPASEIAVEAQDGGHRSSKPRTSIQVVANVPAVRLTAPTTHRSDDTQSGIARALAGADVFSKATAAQSAIEKALARGDPFSRVNAAPTAFERALGGGDPFSSVNAAQRAFERKLAGGDPFSSVNAAQRAFEKKLAGGDPFSKVNAAQTAFEKALAANVAATVGSSLPAIGAPSRPASPAAVANVAAIPPLQRNNADPILSPADLGRLVREARRTNGLSQQAFADLAGVGRRFVSEFESGKATLEFGKVLRCCAAAGIDIFAARRHLA